MVNKKCYDYNHNNKNSNDKAYKKLNDINNYASSSHEMEKISKEVNKEIDKLKKELSLI